MTYSVRFAGSARDDLVRLYEFILERDPADLSLAERALDAIVSAIGLLEEFPFACRKAAPDSPFLRELVIPYGADGHVALFEIENSSTVTVLAVRHQREDDYY